MSNEQQPPPLRLRPRNRDAAAAPAIPVTPIPAPMDQVSEISATHEVALVANAAPGRFRLKPKSPLGENELTSGPEGVYSSPLPAAGDSTANAPRLKLKLAPSAANDTTVASLSEPYVAAEVFVSPASVPAITDEATIVEVPAPQAMSALIIPRVAMPEVSVAEPLTEAVAAPTPVAPTAAGVKAIKPKPVAGKRTRLILVLLLLVLVCGGAGTYYFLMQEEPPPPEPLVRRPVAPLVTKADTTVPVTAPVSAPPVAPVPTPKSLGLEPLPDALGSLSTGVAVVAKPVKAPVAPVMTSAFRLWLESVRINGVTLKAGALPRVIINGRLVRPGDTIDATEGIVFESVDTENKCILFRNRAGFVASKPY